MNGKEKKRLSRCFRAGSALLAVLIALSAVFSLAGCGQERESGSSAGETPETESRVENGIFLKPDYADDSFSENSVPDPVVKLVGRDADGKGLYRKRDGSAEGIRKESLFSIPSPERW